MTSPAVRVDCHGCIDTRAHSGRLERVLAECIRDRDRAADRVSELLTELGNAAKALGAIDQDDTLPSAVRRLVAERDELREEVARLRGSALTFAGGRLESER